MENKEINSDHQPSIFKIDGGKGQAEITQEGKLKVTIGNEVKTFNIKFGKLSFSILPEHQQKKIELIVKSVLSSLGEQLDSRSLATMKISGQKEFTQGKGKIVSAQVKYHAYSDQKNKSIPETITYTLTDKTITRAFHELVFKPSIEESIQSPSQNIASHQLQISFERVSLQQNSSSVQKTTQESNIKSSAPPKVNTETKQPPIINNKTNLKNSKIAQTSIDNFKLGDLINELLTQNSEKKFVTLFYGLPEVKQHFKLLTALTEKISTSKDQAHLQRAQSFVLAWIEHYQNYHGDDKQFVQHFQNAIVAISSKLSPENNKLLIEKLKSLNIKFQQEGKLGENGKIKTFDSIPLREEMKIKSGPLNIAERLNNIKKNNKYSQQDVKVLATDIKNINMYYLSKVKQNELTNLAWNKDNGIKAPNVVALTEQFNKISNFIVNQIMDCQNSKQANKMIAYFIDVAKRLKIDGDFNGYMQIYGALINLNVFQVANLKNDEKSSEKINKLEDVTKNNSKNMRENINKTISTSKIVVPYPGTYFGDLTMNDNKKNEIDDKINGSKLDNASKAVSVLLKCLDPLKERTINFKSNLINVLEEYKKVDQKEFEMKLEKLKSNK